MADRLAGLIALVTGAGSGIGRAVALRFLAEGAEVWFADLDDTAAREACGERPGARPVACDIADLGSVEAAFAQIPGRLDVVVANAGIQLIGQDAAIADCSPEVWQRTVDVNLTGCFNTLRTAVRRMRSQALRADARGSIIVTGSPCGLTGEGRGFAAYSATKAGDHGLARTTAADYADVGIRVNTVIPGHTLTPLVRRLREDPELARAVDARIPLGRPGTPEELTGIYVHLASDESSYSTGGLFQVDGGMTTT